MPMGRGRLKCAQSSVLPSACFGATKQHLKASDKLRLPCSPLPPSPSFSAPTPPFSSSNCRQVSQVLLTVICAYKLQLGLQQRRRRRRRRRFVLVSLQQAGAAGGRQGGRQCSHWHVANSPACDIGWLTVMERRRLVLSCTDLSASRACCQCCQLKWGKK